MTIASLGSLGTSITTTLTTLLPIYPGKTAFVYIISDNADSDGLSDQHHSVTGGHGVWTKIGEARSHAATSTRGNVITSLWKFISDRNIEAGLEITCSIDIDPPSPIESQVIMAGWLFDVDLGYALRLVPDITNVVMQNDQMASIDPVTFTGMEYRQHLYLRIAGMESNNTDVPSYSAGFTPTQSMRSTASSYAVSTRGEFLIETSSGHTSSLNWADNSSTSVIGAVFEEVYVVPIIPITEILPEEEVRETWEWKTDVITSINQDIEKRIALRISPRISISYDMLSFNDTDRRVNFVRLFNEANTVKYVPFFQYASPLTQAGASGDTRIYFDPEISDIRADDPIIIYSRSMRSFELFAVDATHADGATLTSTLGQVFAQGSYVVPARECYVVDGSGLEMTNILGTVKYAAIEKNPREQFVNPLYDPEIKRLNGIPILHRRPLVNSAMDEKFYMNNSYIDNDVGVYTKVQNRVAPYMMGKFTFKTNRVEEPEAMNYWRKLFHEIKGRRGSFYAPTWRRDFIMTQDMNTTVGLDYMICEDNKWKDHFEGKDEFTGVQLMAEDGDIIYRKIVFSHLNVDGLTIGFSEAVPDVTKWKSQNMIVSMMPRFRMNDDKIDIEHVDRFSTFSINMKTVRE